MLDIVRIDGSSELPQAGEGTVPEDTVLYGEGGAIQLRSGMTLSGI